MAETSSANPLYVAWTSTAAGSIVVNRPGNASWSAGLTANEEPSWITMSLNRATAVCPSGVSVSTRKRATSRSNMPPACSSSYRCHSATAASYDASGWCARSV